MDRKPLVAIIATVALAAAGCGGTGTLSQADLVKQVNAICKHRNAQSDAVVASAARAHSMVLVTQRMVPVAAKTIADLAALKPPADLRARYARFLTYERAFLANGRRVAAGQRIRELPYGHPRDRLIRELGFTACK